MLKVIKAKIKVIRDFLRENKINKVYSPSYKIEEIQEDKDTGQYTAVIRLINKNSVFYIKPEELLADDILVDQFSPRDIRALTYLGYLGINAPKYKILAKRLLTKHDKIAFILKKKGEKDIIIKTAQQILNEQEILGNLNPEDTKTIGFTFAEEGFYKENQQKKDLINKIIDKN